MSYLIRDAETISPVTYGNFEDTVWYTLPKGKYVMTATSAQLSNVPFDIESSQTYYIYIDVSNKFITPDTYITHNYFVLKASDATATPLTYHRVFKNTIADFQSRGFKGDNSFQNFSAFNSATGLTFALTAGSTKNICEFFTEATELLRGNEDHRLLYTSGSEFGTLLDETNDKYLYPSNFKSGGKTYVPYSIRVRISGTISGPSGTDVEYQIRMRRSLDNTKIATNRIIKTQATILDKASTVFSTFINGETDPFVVDGMYIELFAPVGSVTLNLTEISVLTCGSY